MEGESIMPKVSVILPVHNGMPYLPLAVESILQQTFRDFEFIIVDDASTDDTARYLSDLGDPRLRVIHNEQNLGVAKSLNRAIAIGRGEYIARQDADDVSLPGRLEAQVNYLDRHPDIAVLGTRATFIDGAGPGNATGIWAVPTAGIEIKWRLLFDNCRTIIHPSAMMRTSILRECGGYPEATQFSLAEDYELWCRMARHHGIANLEQSLVKFRIHGSSVSRRHNEEQQQQARKIALANQTETIGSSRVTELGYGAYCSLFQSSPSVKPDLTLGAIHSGVQFLRNLQHAFYVKGEFCSRSVLLHRKHWQWIWGKHLVALSIRSRFGLRCRITSALLGSQLILGSLAAGARLLVRGIAGFATSEASLARFPSLGEAE